MNYDFITIPREVVLSDKIRDTDRLVYGVIYSMSQMNNKKFTGKNTTISKMCGISTGSVANSLVRLTEAGFITAIFKDLNKRVRIEIIPHVTYKNETEFPQMMTHVSSSDESKVSSNDEQNNTNNNNINNIVEGLPSPKEDVNLFEKTDNQKISFIFKSLSLINPTIYSLVGFKPQRQSALNIYNDMGRDKFQEVFTWYVKQFKVNRQYLPIATVPTKLVEKMGDILKIYEEENKSTTSQEILNF